jgi:hypothetical protein
MSTIEELLAKQEISELIVRYGHAIDRRDTDLLETLFTEDATLSYGLFNGPATALFALQRGARLPGFLATHHAISNILIDVRGAEADAQSYLNVVHRAERNGVLQDEHVRARYLDRLRKRDGRWRFAARVLVYDWSWIAPADAEPWWVALGEDCRTGAHGEADPSSAFGFLRAPRT